MKFYLVLLLLVGLACAFTHPPWKDNTEYVYLVNGRTLTSLHELADHYTGVFLKAKLCITPRSDGKLQARVIDAQYAQIHTRLPDGWNTEVPETLLKYKELNLSKNPFQIVIENGIIKSVIVEKEVANWEANIIKSIVSQFQLDIQGRNVINSSFNNLPTEDKFEGFFKTMEETITGETETSYEIHRVPEYLIQSEPWLVPKLQLKEDGQIFEVIKFKNYTNSKEKPIYHYGFGELTNGEPSSNKMGGFFTRQSNSRVILAGKLSKYTIQQVQTSNKIIINPILNSKDQGSVVSTINVTLYEVKNQDDEPRDLVNPVEIGNLVYTYEAPFAQSNEVRQKLQEKSLLEESSEEATEDDMEYQPRPMLNRAAEFPLLPYYMGYYGRSIKANSAFSIKNNVEMIAREISEDLLEPEEILVRSTLSKYAMLCSFVRLMDGEEMHSVAQMLYTQNKQSPERVAWEVFRDAVAEAGTGPSLINVQKWIESSKIEKEEASEVVASMAYAVRTPTEEYMIKFFELIKNPKIINQEFLNETALLSFTCLVNRVYVKRNESHNQYPVYTFKSFYTKESKEFVTFILVPYLTQQLHDAVTKADSRKIHVYIRALGNVGHKKILEAFEPYLEGKKQVSQFQRMLMVLSMDKLVVSEPVIARSVLYRIYSNIAEVPEVRVVAVYQLMRTVPPVEMIQRMAEFTHMERQEQVNAAVKSAIESASQLNNQGSEILRRSAKIAKHLLTQKEYSQHQSFNFLQDFAVENMDVEFKQNILQVGSVDHTLPKGIKSTLRGNINGMKHYFFNIQAMISSIKELTNVLYQQTDKYNQQSKQQPKDHQWSSAKIVEALNLQTNEREQLEGFIYSEIESLQRFWSFNNRTIEQLPQAIREREQMLKDGKKFSYVKLKQLKEIALSFPTEMGIPFLWTYDLPLLVQFAGKIKAIAKPEISQNNKLFMPKLMLGTIDASVTVVTKVQSHLSIVTPFDHQVYISGFDKNAQIHLPLTGKVTLDLEDEISHVKFEMEVKENHKDARLLHYSSWPYTSHSDVMSLQPVALRPNTHQIKPEGHTHRSFDFIVGKKETGINFRVWGHHPSQSFNILQLASILKSEGIATMWQRFWDDSSLEQTEASIAFIPSQSTTRKVSLYLEYQQKDQNQPKKNEGKGFWNYIFSFKQPNNQTHEEFWAEDQLPFRVEHDNKKRKETLMTYVGAGIQNAQLHFFDAVMEFKGDKTYEHIFTIAAAKSNVVPQSRFVSFYKNNAEDPTSFGLQIKGYVPNTNELDLSYSLNTPLKSKYEVFWQYGQSEEQSSKIKAAVNLNRSTARKQFLEKKALYQVCQRQMQEGNRHLSACQNMTLESNFLDDINVELQYENFKKESVNFVDNIFKGVRFWYYPITNISAIQPALQNKIKMQIQFHPEYLRQVNITVRANDEETKMHNLPVCKAILLGQTMDKENTRTTCVLDKNTAQTFSNLTYRLALGSEWAVMMLYNQESQQEYCNVIVRELATKQREIKIIFKGSKTDDQPVELTIKPKKLGSTPSASVSVNDKEVEFNDNHAANLFNRFVEIYALPKGEVKLEIQGWFYIIFDGERVKLTATSNKLRDSTVGLCGRFNQDQYEDFWTPNNCVVRSAEKFVESYVVEGKRQWQQQQFQQEFQECIPKVLPLYADVISDNDVERKVDEENISSTGTILRSNYVEENGDVCFTIYPVPVCKNGARMSTIKEVPVHCIKETKTATYLKNQIDIGTNPDFSQKSPTKTVQLQIPQQCY